METDPKTHVAAWIIRHKYRSDIYLGRDKTWRNFPFLFADQTHASEAMDKLGPLASGDWLIVGVWVVER